MPPAEVFRSESVLHANTEGTPPILINAWSIEISGNSDWFMVAFVEIFVYDDIFYIGDGGDGRTFPCFLQFLKILSTLAYYFRMRPYYIRS